MSCRHWKTNELLSQDINHNVHDPRHKFARMHRANLQKALLKKLPVEILHLRKKFAGVVVDEVGVTVTFEDHTSITADVVIGADGIKSVQTCVYLYIFFEVFSHEPKFDCADNFRM